MKEYTIQIGEVFKAVCDKFPDSGPTPENIDKILWEMLKNRQINVGLENSDEPIFLTTKQIPKNAKLITNPK